MNTGSEDDFLENNLSDESFHLYNLYNVIKSFCKDLEPYPKADSCTNNSISIVNEQEAYDDHLKNFLEINLYADDFPADRHTSEKPILNCKFESNEIKEKRTVEEPYFDTKLEISKVKIKPYEEPYLDTKVESDKIKIKFMVKIPSCTQNTELESNKIKVGCTTEKTTSNSQMKNNEIKKENEFADYNIITGLNYNDINCFIANMKFKEESFSVEENTNYTNEITITNSRIDCGTTKDLPQKRGRPKKFDILECNWCRKNCKSSANLKLHLRTHTGERPYSCSYCELMFKQQSHLKSHMRRHTGEKPYKCTECSAAFIQGSALKVHFKNKHTKSKNNMKTVPSNQSVVIKNFFCHFCDKTYLDVYKKDHMKQHKTERKFSCIECPKTYKQRNRYLNHMKIHETHTDVRSLNKENVESVTVSNNLKLGNNSRSKIDLCRVKKEIYDCTYCNKTFKTSQNLTIHYRTHTGEKPYKCEVCHVFFRQISHLKCHFNRHTGFLPYSCSLCNKKYTRLYSASNHMKSVHSEKGFIKLNSVSNV